MRLRRAAESLAFVPVLFLMASMVVLVGQGAPVAWAHPSPSPALTPASAESSPGSSPGNSLGSSLGSSAARAEDVPDGAPEAAGASLARDTALSLAPGSSAAVIRLAERAPDEEPDTGLGLDLPASYSGDLPCLECETLRFQLNLWPDHVFNLRRHWLPGTRSQDALGRWWIDHELGRLVLWDGEDKMEFTILPGRLRLVDRDREAGVMPDRHDLTGKPGVTPMAIDVPMRGMVSFLADHAQITECLTGRVYPLGAAQEFPTLEAAYLAAGVAQGAPLMASFQGRVLEAGDKEGGQAGPLVVVNRFTGVWPEENCEQAMSNRSLTNTYWRIVRLGKTQIGPNDQPREPHLVLKEGENRFVATVGCNQLFGGFERDGDKLSFKGPAATMMACPAPLDDWERMLAGALTAARGWRVNGEALELLDSSGMQIALFQAVDLP